MVEEYKVRKGTEVLHRRDGRVYIVIDKCLMIDSYKGEIQGVIYYRETKPSEIKVEYIEDFCRNFNSLD